MLSKDLLQFLKHGMTLAGGGGLVGTLLFHYTGSTLSSLSTAAVVGMFVTLLVGSRWPDAVLSAAMSALAAYLGGTVTVALASTTDPSVAVVLGALLAVLAGYLIYLGFVSVYFLLRFGNEDGFMRQLMYGLFFAGGGGLLGALAFGITGSILVGTAAAALTGVLATRYLSIKWPVAVVLSAVTSTMAAFIGDNVLLALIVTKGAIAASILGALSAALAGWLIYLGFRYAGLCFGHGYAFWKTCE